MTKLTLYHYVHCPFCVRVRMTLGYLKLAYQSVVLPYDDEKTPLDLTGIKMLPIMKFDQEAKNESLEIMTRLDEKHALRIQEMCRGNNFDELNSLLSRVGSQVHSLAMPYWIYTPEFNESSRIYFQKKKEQKRGPFKALVKNRKAFEDELSKDLVLISKDLRPFYQSDKFTVYDILIASHLWGLYVVPEFQFPDDIHQYLQKIKEICRFDYHQDYWG